MEGVEGRAVVGSDDWTTGVAPASKSVRLSDGALKSKKASRLMACVESTAACFSGATGDVCVATGLWSSSLFFKLAGAAMSLERSVASKPRSIVKVSLASGRGACCSFAVGSSGRGARKYELSSDL